MSGSDIISQLINRLEALVNDGKRVPFAGNLMMIDEQAFLDIIDQLRVAVPEEFRIAKKLNSERERLLSQARAESEKIIDQAQDQVSRIMDESELVRLADEQASHIIDEAQDQAARMIQDADEYTLRMLTGLGKQLDGLHNKVGTLITEVYTGRQLLQQSQESGDSGYDPLSEPEEE